jgi:SAM-dependent methyltransferase
VRTSLSDDPYEVLGPLYDQPDHVEMATSFYRAVEPILRARVAPHEWVLDLGCGTGLIAHMAARRGLRVVGVDRSHRMLDIAHKRCRRQRRNTRFVHGDLVHFQSHESFSAVCCSGDTINHLSPSELRTAIRSMERTVAPGGVLLFDTLNRFCFRHYWTGALYYDECSGGDLVMECDWDAAAGIGSVRIVTYVRKNGVIKKSETVFNEYLHDCSTIRRALRDAGFDNVRRTPWTAWTDQNLEPAFERDLWVASKKR